MLCGISVRVLYSYTVKKTPRFKKISKNMMCFMGTPPNAKKYANISKRPGDI